MSRCAFIGDEVTAAGLRLAGVEVHILAPDSAAGLLEELLPRVDLLLVTAEAADRLPGRQLQDAVAAGRPSVLVLADARGRQRPPDLAAALRRQLGLLE